MLKSYFKTAWRNLWRSKVYSFINISGLAVAMAGFIIILLYLNYELSYDAWDNSLKRVYKISAQTDEEILEQTPAPLAGLLKQNSPAIEAATTMQSSGDFEVLLGVDDKKIYQRGGTEADSLFFKVFPYRFMEGSSSTALDKPNAIVISKEVAIKLFGNDNPIGKTIRIFNAFECEVTGIIQQPGSPSHLNVQFVYRSPYEKQNLFWGNQSYNTYVKTKKSLPVNKLEEDVNYIYYENRLKKGAQTLADFRKAGHAAGLFADAVPRIHNFPKHGSSNFGTVSVLLLLAVLLLLLAGSINFSNLTVASSVRRAKEVGVRKVLGSGRGKLLWMFIGEISLQCIISLFIALLLVNAVIPFFNNEFNVTINLFGSGNLLSLSLQIAASLLAVILLSGLYPSLFLSRYNITKVLKGDYSSGTKGTAFRNALIVVQFAVAAFFIIGTLVISRQMHYMQSKDKGFSGEHTMRLEVPQIMREAKFDITRNELLNVPGVKYVSKTTKVPGDAVTDTSTYAFKYNGKEYRMTSVKVSDDYFKTLNIALKKGRLFNSGYTDQNTRSAIINESAARKLNMPNPVGATITFAYCDTVPVQVIGVVKDFNVSGFENAVQPVVFTIGNKACMFQSGGGILVKLDGTDIPRTVSSIEQVWKKLSPDFPIRYSFLDDNFQNLFASYLRLQKIINLFGFTAIFISVMGLFALTAFLVNQRTKEIGIRKILGAGAGDLSLLLAKNFIKLVLVSVIVAIPAGWWAANEWLKGFAYRIDISWGLFVTAAIIIIAIALLTISIQTIKAAVANPVKSLRTE